MVSGSWSLPGGTPLKPVVKTGDTTRGTPPQAGYTAVNVPPALTQDYFFVTIKLKTFSSDMVKDKWCVGAEGRIGLGEGPIIS